MQLTPEQAAAAVERHPYPKCEVSAGSPCRGYARCSTAQQNLQIQLDALERRLRQHRIPGLRGRTAALRQLVLQAPAPVVAKMLGYKPDHTARLVAEAGGTWTRYAAGDHTR